MVFHVCNDTDETYRLDGCRLFLPRGPDTWRWLYPARWLREQMRPFSEAGRIEPSELGGACVPTGRFPLTSPVIEVRLRSDDGETRSLWACLRIKRESFDISGGWVSSATPQGPALTHVPFLKTLRGMHVNAAHIADVPGYTDRTEPNGLYARYPLKYFNRLQPIDRYDTDAMLPRIYAVEFLGEPQYGYGRNGKLPQQVWKAFRPYASSRLATTLTLSESQNWHLYAAVADYAHYDAYRVSGARSGCWNASISKGPPTGTKKSVGRAGRTGTWRPSPRRTPRCCSLWISTTKRTRPRSSFGSGRHGRHASSLTCRPISVS